MKIKNAIGLVILSLIIFQSSEAVLASNKKDDNLIHSTIVPNEEVEKDLQRQLGRAS